MKRSAILQIVYSCEDLDLPGNIGRYLFQSLLAHLVRVYTGVY